VLDDDHWRLPAELVDDAKRATLGELDDLLSLVPRFGCDPVEQNYNFAEICHRYRQRWDMRVPGEAVSKLTDAAVQRALPVILGLDALPMHPDEGFIPLARRLPAGRARRTERLEPPARMLAGASSATHDACPVRMRSRRR
jgi:hypothetical protein